MRRSILALTIVLTASAASAGKRQLPPKTAIDSAKRLVAETFRKELSESDKTPAVKAMLQAAAKTEDDHPAQAALYLSAAETAARIGDTRLAFDAIDQLLVVFDVDEFEVKGALLEVAADSVKTNEARISVANRGLELADAALAAGRFDDAESALKTAASVSGKLRDADLRKEIAVKRRDVEKARKQAAHLETELAEARKKLTSNPRDSAANEALGRYLAFDRNDWAAGLKHLVESGDAQLRQVAKADLAGGGEPAQLAAIGDQWWTLADGAEAQRDRSGFRSRAVFWYTRAAGQLKGFSKTRIEKRIAEAGAAALAAAAEQTGGQSGNFIDIVLAPGVLMRLVKIPASEDGKVKEFYLGQTEVTQKQWQAVMGNNPSNQKGSELPVGLVAWTDCRSFIDKLNGHTLGKRFTFRFPTKQEYDHAYLAGEKHAFYVTRYAEYSWTRDNSRDSLHPVGTLKANAWGLFDMIGNSWEWCADGSIWGGSVGQPISEHTDAPRHGTYDQPSASLIGFRVAAETR